MRNAYLTVKGYGEHEIVIQSHALFAMLIALKPKKMPKLLFKK